MKNDAPKSIDQLSVKHPDYTISTAHQGASDDEILVVLPPSNVKHNGIVQVGGGSGSGAY
jgi:hypothetical protein